MSGRGSPDKKDVLNQISSGSTNRRGFLMSSGALIAGTSALSSTAGAKQPHGELGEVVDQYEDEQKLRSAITSTAGDLLDELGRRGVIRHKSAEEQLAKPVLTGKDITSIEDGGDSEGIILSGHRRGGLPTANIILVEQHGDYTVRVMIEPEVGKSSALIIRESGDKEAIKLDQDSGEFGSISEIGTEGNCTDYFWYGDCNGNPSDDCACTESDPCGCYSVKVQCCDTYCNVADYKYGDCVASTTGCCDDFECSDAC